MKKIKFFPIVLVISLLLCCLAPAASAEGETVQAPELSAKAVVLADVETGSIIYSKNMNETVSPASLTKIMTVLLAVEAVENGTAIDTVITAQSDCLDGLDDDSSNAGIQPGEQLTLEELMYCAMVHSANEACNVIAEYLAGSVSAFVEQMNARAAALGCTGTAFVNTNGLTANGHYTTAYDMYLIAREAVSHPLFMTICGTATYTVPATNMSEERTFYNSNALISSGSQYGSGYVYEYATGVKTGFTRAAGNCLVSTATKDGLSLLAVVMGCDGPNNNESAADYGNFVDSRTLYDWAFDNFSYQTILTREDLVTTAEVELAAGGGNVELYPQDDLTVLVPGEVTAEDITLNVNLFTEKLVAPINSGTILGEADVYVNGENYGTIKLVNNVSVDLSRGQYFKQQLGSFFSRPLVIIVLILLLLFLGGYIALVLRYRSLRRKHLQEKREAEQRRRARIQVRQMTSVPQEDPGEPTRRFRRIDPSERQGYHDDDED